jgi:hypothetical protein
MPSWSHLEAAAPDLATAGPTHLFRLDVQEASAVVVNADETALIITVWTPQGGVRTMQRA